jgi:hypothetical protein
MSTNCINDLTYLYVGQNPIIFNNLFNLCNVGFKLCSTLSCRLIGLVSCHFWKDLWLFYLTFPLALVGVS